MVLSNIAIRRPVTTILFTAAVIIFGLFSLQRMGVDLYPEVDVPVVTVTTSLPGADAEIIDSDVTEPLEDRISVIEGVDTLRSESREGRSRITVEFVLTKDIDVGAQEVRDAVNLAQRELPLDAEPPIVQKVDLDASAIMWIAATTTGDYRRLANYADQVVRERIQTVPGVGGVQLGGFRERQIRVWLEPATLEAHGLTAVDVGNAIRAKHAERPGGRLEQPDRELVIKVKGEYETVDELRRLVVSSSDGALIRLEDIATITDGSEDFRSFSRSNGIPAVSLGVRKQSGANTVAVANGVRQLVEDMQDELPDGISLRVNSDNSRFIVVAMRDVIGDLILGALLTGVVLLLFLRNFRLTLISMVAVPTSLIGCFIAMYFLDFTINNITMLAMSLAIGIVIDDTIVVLENIFRHVESLGENAMDAARNGTGEVGLAVLAASSAVACVFLPVAFMEGVIGRFFFQFGLSVAIAIAISVTVAFTVIPMLCSRLVKHNPNHGVVFRFFERGFARIEKTYGRCLGAALKRRWAVIGLAAVVFVAGLFV